MLSRIELDGREGTFPVEVLIPAQARTGERIPVVVRALGPDGAVRTDVTTTLHIGVEAEPQRVSLKKGVGSGLMTVSGAGNWTVNIDGAKTSRRVEVVDSMAERTYAGTLTAAEAVWDASADRVVMGDLIIPQDVTLVIQAGTRVRLGSRVNVQVEGGLRVEGESGRPVWFTAVGDEPWGGIELHGSKSTIRYAFFTHGGGDESRVFGHSGSQPVLKTVGAEVELQHVFLTDNPGKALGASGGRLSFVDGLITRCDTGGEFAGSLVRIARSHILDIPDADGIAEDDDNDGLYFAGPHASGLRSSLEHTIIMTTEDDAVDHNGARLEIRHSWLEGALHEGVAASNRDSVWIYDTVVRRCGQGIEAGYGAPQIFVDHTVVVENGVGLRFGDEYEPAATGRLRVTNSILYANTNDIQAFDPQSPLPTDMFGLSYLLTYNTVVQPCTECVMGRPQFDAAFYLKPGSPGVGAASDGTDLGRISKNPSGSIARVTEPVGFQSTSFLRPPTPEKTRRVWRRQSNRHFGQPTRWVYLNQRLKIDHSVVNFQP